MDEFKEEKVDSYDFLSDLSELVEYAKDKDFIGDSIYEKEIFIASFMDLLMPRPREFNINLMFYIMNPKSS